MVLYTVYKASFETQKGTFRQYVGYTGNASKREDKLGLGGVNWTKPLKKGSLKLRVLVADVESKAVVLALEAWHAAKAISRDSEHVRGVHG
jgi:ribosomal protein L7Ae-like RNA K-turn-binding protein